MSEANANPLLPEIEQYYARGREAGRLFEGLGRLERVRTQEILRRHLPPSPAVVLDVGGGAGVYALWLARLGYEVHLLDGSALHVRQAREASAAQPDHPLASTAVADARALDWPDHCADAVLLLGPLYHLTECGERVQALSEARRVLRPGGVVLAAGISRFASMMVGFMRHMLDDPAFQVIVAQDLSDGQHRNLCADLPYFTTAFFHHPDELADEVTAAGLMLEALLAVEGIGSVLSDFDAHWDVPERRQRLLAAVRRLEAEPTLLGVSAHLIAVGRNKEMMV